MHVPFVKVSGPSGCNGWQQASSCQASAKLAAAISACPPLMHFEWDGLYRYAGTVLRLDLCWTPKFSDLRSKSSGWARDKDHEPADSRQKPQLFAQVLRVHFYPFLLFDSTSPCRHAELAACSGRSNQLVRSKEPQSMSTASGSDPWPFDGDMLWPFPGPVWSEGSSVFFSARWFGCMFHPSRPKPDTLDDMEPMDSRGSAQRESKWFLLGEIHRNHQSSSQKGTWNDQHQLCCNHLPTDMNYVRICQNHMFLIVFACVHLKLTAGCMCEDDSPKSNTYKDKKMFHISFFRKQATP